MALPVRPSHHQGFHVDPIPLSANHLLEVTTRIKTLNKPGAIDIASDAFLQWWLPTLGAGTTVMAHRFVALLAARPDETVRFTMDELCATFGLRHSVRAAQRHLERLAGIGLAGYDLADITVTATVVHVAIDWQAPPLEPRQHKRLPAYLRTQYLQERSDQ